MYRLDSRYNPTVTFPCTTADLLRDIAWHFDFRIGFTPAADVIEYVPRNATCREVIGYIAGVNGGFAKFDRSGVLQLKRLEYCNFVLSRSQYTELSVKADVNEVRQIDFIVENDIFTEGKGTKLTTYRQYNPFASHEAARRIFNHWNGFSYHGLTVKMRGLPYLESGDAILVQDDFENTHYFALISDYTLIYDGGLTARLVSKSKNPIDDYDEPMTQQRMIESMSENLRVRYTNYENENHIILNTETQGIASINFNLESRTFAVFNTQFNITSLEDCVLILEYRINNIKVGQTPRIHLFAQSPDSICLYNCFRVIRPGRNTLSLSARITSGDAVIAAGDLLASVSGQYMLGDNGPQIPEINIAQSIQKYELSSMKLPIKKLSVKPEKPELHEPAREGYSEEISMMSVAPLKPVLRGFTDSLLMDSMFIKAEWLPDDKVVLVFSNVIAVRENEAVNMDAFAVTFGVNELQINLVEVIENEIIISTESLSNFNEVVIKYDSHYGNLLSAATGNPLQLLNYILNLEEGK